VLFLKVLLRRRRSYERVRLINATSIVVPVEPRRYARRAVGNLEKDKAVLRYLGSTGAFAI
jgi:hypothetical protein